MTNTVTEQQARDMLQSLLGEVGVERGDVVYLAVDMGALPLPSLPFELSREAIKTRERRLCDFVLDALRDFIGPQGTVLAPAFSYSCSKPGSVYVHEDTPSEIGPFPEYMRNHPEAIRSIHPLFSVSGIGPAAHDLLQTTGKAAFGAMSVFERLNKYACKFLFLGSSLGGALTYMHHLEQGYGCNHRYNKAIDVKVMLNGALLPGPWLAYVGFRSVQARSQAHDLESVLREAGVLREVLYLNQPFQCVDIVDVNDYGYQMLINDPCAFMTDGVEIVLDETESMKTKVSGGRVEFHLVRTSKNTSD